MKQNKRQIFNHNHIRDMVFFDILSVINWTQPFSQKTTVSYIFYIIETMKGLIFTLIFIITSTLSMGNGEIGEYCGQ